MMLKCPNCGCWFENSCPYCGVSSDDVEDDINEQRKAATGWRRERFR